ncbi:toxin-antitoxin system YwqK family antitoxin [Chitinibacter sp. S2-10]|uniref:toxin-antitoxin system YwqK family antitoxin n=1 Tax=Chitinibacter sp. S2-10 TaxID=3373597 RepID=UPI003977DD45
MPKTHSNQRNAVPIATRSSRKLLSVSVLLLLSGCFSTVDCNSSAAKEIALSVITQELNNFSPYREALPAFGTEFKVENIKTTAKNDDTETCSCNADYAFVYNGTERAINFDYDVSMLKDKGEIQVELYAKAIKDAIYNLMLGQRPIKNGPQVHTDPATGNVMDKLNWKDNKMDGVQEFFNPKNNALILKVNFDNGQKSGLQQGWSEDGATLLTELTWTDGKATGYEKKLVNGKVVADFKYVDGLRTGFASNYIKGLGAYIETYYKDGVKILDKEFGVHDAEGQDVRLIRESPYFNNQPHGIEKTYNSEGKLIRETEYKDGLTVSEKSYESTAEQF